MRTLRPGVPTSLRLPFELRRVLRKQARKEHRSISGLLVHVLDTYAQNNKLYEVHPAPERGKSRRRTSDPANAGQGEVEADIEEGESL